MLVALTGAGAAFGCLWGLVTGAVASNIMAAVTIAVIDAAGVIGSFPSLAALGWLLEVMQSHRPGASSGSPQSAY
ncbi:MAG: hypothetical protein Kow0073_11250 [Immundisolibacter sp.]